MEDDLKKALLDYSADELLDEFGKGNHKPGSGSAAAFHGLLAAKLITTVIALTNKEKRRKQYEEWLPELLRMNSEIIERIYPRLKELFQADSIQFDKAITLRKQRDSAKDSKLKADLASQALKELVPATEIPLEIAGLCVELGDIAGFVFDRGFAAVRGDSAVALNGAASAAAGCLAIIELNLLSFDWDDWCREIRAQTKALKVAHERLLLKSASCLQTLERENETKRNQHLEFLLADIRSGRWEDIRLTDAGLEEMTRKIQNALWTHRDFFWTENTPGTHRDVLKPGVVLEKILGYKFGITSLGSYVSDEGEFKVAGLIDKKEKTVLISRDMPSPQQNFTAAHELGHALLHKDVVLHRDRPMDGSSSNKDFKERQADRFAAFFLMPERQLRSVFEELFGMERFVLNENNVFSLGEGRLSAFRQKVKDVDALARRIASAEYFQGSNFKSLADIFNVSIGAMAIRLRELDLVKY